MRPSFGTLLLAGTLAFAVIGASSGVRAGPDDITAVLQYCTTKTNMPAEICTCLGGKAGLMSDLQQRYLAATLTENEAVLAMLRPQMTIPEMTEVATFFVREPAACAAVR